MINSTSITQPPVDDVVGPQSSDDEHRGLAAIVRDRLRKAAAGKRKELVAECLEDIEIQREVARAQPPRQAPSEQLSDATLQAAAVKSRNGSDKGASQILLGGPQVPPCAETDSKVEDLFCTTPHSAQERQHLEQALQAAASTRRKVQISPAHASRCCARLQPAAGPGPSGFRNSFIVLIHSNPWGAECIGRLVQAMGPGTHRSMAG